ncbi:MAG: hypothetical protein H7Y15_13945, partial [Pseudonocardia sp.]|nr:hypothetical protein [Pseudonocardia sp.]
MNTADVLVPAEATSHTADVLGAAEAAANTAVDTAAVLARALNDLTPAQLRDLAEGRG